MEQHTKKLAIANLNESLRYGSSSDVIVCITRVMHILSDSLLSDLPELASSPDLQDFEQIVLQGIIAWSPGIKDCFSIAGQQFPSEDPKTVVELYKSAWNKHNLSDDMILEGIMNCVMHIVSGLTGNVSLFHHLAGERQTREIFQKIFDTIHEIKQTWQLGSAY